MAEFIKRALDIAVAATLLLLLSPLLAWLAWRVKNELGTPVFFRQRRIGLDEEPFDLIKFRTMWDACDEAGNLLPDDQRLTDFGQWLRATSLDELPELWNILIGKMSLVGPRPLLPEYLPYYKEREQIRHRMRPGITGLAQVSGRNALTWDARLALDADYVLHFSLARDIAILARTAAVVLKREGISAEGHVTMQRLDVERANSPLPPSRD
jgi:lipopolysaccharide/colanic/teichoic acid biosynthesis glycosyltransferase